MMESHDGAGGVSDVATLSQSFDPIPVKRTQFNSSTASSSSRYLYTNHEVRQQHNFGDGNSGSISQSIPMQTPSRCISGDLNNSNHATRHSIDDKKSKSSATPKVNVPRQGTKANSNLITEEVKSDKAIASSKGKVDHTYVDYARGASDMTFNFSLHNYFANSEAATSKKGEFPHKLMTLLYDAHYYFSDIVSWKPHGRAFRVHDPRRFQQEVLSRYFKTSQINSFRKQLSLWNFKRITKGEDAGSYYHPRFLRALPGLMKQMHCKKIKGIGKALVANPDAEPNFYRNDLYRELPDFSMYPPTLADDHSSQHSSYHNCNLLTPSYDYDFNRFPPYCPSISRYYDYELDYRRSCPISSDSQHGPCETTSSALIPRRQPVSSAASSDPYVTEEEDCSVCPEEINSIYSQMYFPEPFTRPPPASHDVETLSTSEKLIIK